MNKKDLERRARELAEEELKARAASEDRQERIKVLWEAITSGELARDAKVLAENGLFRSLVELAELQKCEIKYLIQFRRDWERVRTYYPEQLKKLNSESAFTEVWLAIGHLITVKKPTEYEIQRRISGLGSGGLIEYEFSGALEADMRKHVLFVRLPMPATTCLDDVFEGSRIDMMRLQELFGVHRNRFPKKLPGFKMGRHTLYDYGAVVKIMDALLGEAPHKRKRPTRGRARRLWLSNPDLRNRVLSGIEARIKSFGCPEQIKGEFLAVIHHHLSDSAKK